MSKIVLESVGVIGVGVVGSAFIQKCASQYLTTYIYDIEDTTMQQCATNSAYIHPCRSVEQVCANVSCVFLALPTQPTSTGYSLTSFHSFFKILNKIHFLHPVYIMSTLSPDTLDMFHMDYSTLHLFHIPEFLSSQSAELDSIHPTQHYMLLGVPQAMSCAVSDRARVLLQNIIGNTQQVMVVKAKESASCKVFCNAFYAVKVQLCNEFYHICKDNNISYDIVRMLMLQNGWIHPMHTQVPGPAGTFSFGGKCLPKDLQALVNWTKVDCPVLKATNSRCEDENM